MTGCERHCGPAEVAGGAASLAGGQQSVATRVEAAWVCARQGDKCLSNAREASVASDADMTDEERMGGEKPVSMISPMCRLTTIKSQNVVERCVRRPEGEGMCDTQRDAGDGLVDSTSPRKCASRREDLAAS